MALGDLDLDRLSALLMILKDAGVTTFSLGEMRLELPAPERETTAPFVAQADRGVRNAQEQSDYHKLFRGQMPQFATARAE